MNLTETKSPTSAILIYHRLDMGGIETLIIRTANELNARGIKITVFSRPGKLIAMLDKKITFHPFDRYKDIYEHASIISADTVLIAFDPLSYMVMRRLQAMAFAKTKSKSTGHTGIFHPRSLFWSGDPFPIRFLNSVVFKLTTSSEFFFMSEAVRKSTEIGLGIKEPLKNSIIPLPISGNIKHSWQKFDKNKLSIVSVGRFVPFKAYNKAVPKLVRELLERGVDISWDIWGDGEEIESIQSLIVENKVQKNVFLRGLLPYSDLQRTMLNYDLFIGMGTSALEAANLGMPTLCAVDNISDSCYGYLYQAPTDCIGEYIEGIPLKPFGECVMAFSKLSELERIEVGQRCRQAVANKSGNDTYEQLLVGPKWPGSWFREILSLIIAAPYLWAVDSRKTRVVFRTLRKMFQ